jgi:hypothetical protein
MFLYSRITLSLPSVTEVLQVHTLIIPEKVWGSMKIIRLYHPGIGGHKIPHVLREMAAIY